MRSKPKSAVSVIAGIVTALLAGTATANNVRVANVATQYQDTEKDQVYVAFDLSWENSWRNDVNWDAAWVFIKFRVPGSNEWQHAYLSTNSASHIPAANSEIAAVPDGMGAFVYRSGAYTGDVNYVNTRLLWQYGTNGYSFARGDEVEVSVHAIEMVYVAEGAFYVGDGGEGGSRFTDGAWVSGATTAFQITSEDAIEIGNQAGKLYATGNIGSDGELPAEFPKGFGAFYCMKYEITQGQYVDFLNLLTEAQTSACFPNEYDNYRHTIRQAGDIYEALAPDRACNYLTWQRAAAYTAWAGLRPMTDLEFEKACRGPESPVLNEHAWGTAGRVQHTSHEGEDGSGEETALPVGANHNYNSFNNGPVRVGIYATNGADRVSAGASYWGIMELSGNMWEQVVWVGRNEGRIFSGTHGNGTLSANGRATNSDWPGYSSGTVSGKLGAGLRGGGPGQPGMFNTNLAYLQTSNRAFMSLGDTGHFNAGNPVGFRAVRTAP